MDRATIAILAAATVAVAYFVLIDGAPPPGALPAPDGEAPDPDTNTDTMSTIKNAVARVLAYGPGWARLELADGTVEQRNGARNWRNNNPGNIEYGAFAIAHGAIGSDGRFAIFPTYEDGRAAKAALLFDTSTYRNLTLSQAIARYAPPGENNTGAYQRAVIAAAGGIDQPMRAYTTTQREAILNAMERQEGFRVGTTTTATGQA